MKANISFHRIVPIIAFALGVCVILGNVQTVHSGESPPIVGQTEQVYSLPGSANTRGIAFDEGREGPARLFVLEKSGKVFVYQVPRQAKDPLKQLETIELPKYELDKPKGEKAKDKKANPEKAKRDKPKGEKPKDDKTKEKKKEPKPRPLASPRGLAFAREGGSEVLYYMDWDDSPYKTDDDRNVLSQLWRYDLNAKESHSIDLSRYTNRIGDREVFDLYRDGDELVISFKPDGYTDGNVRVMRGLVRLRWTAPYDKYPEFVRHMPDAGTAPSRGVTSMTLDGVKYLWGTAGNHLIYCADEPTGRGLFFFDRPKSYGGICNGLAFGDGSLWVAEDVRGADRVYRVNVTKNLDAPLVGPKILRRLIMTLKAVPEEPDTKKPGKVYHYYSRPYDTGPMPCQGVWPKSEKIVDLSKVPNARIHPFTMDPGGDRSSRQTMQSVVYLEAPAREYESHYEIKLWVRPWRKFVYPHRVNSDDSALAGTNYLEDDSELYNLTDTKTYDGFKDRIKRHIEKKYGVPADMENRYWLARNMIEYLQDNYYYPRPALHRSATVDFERKHYDANPGNFKIELSDHPYDKNQIIACSGTSVMVAGAMRYLGVPARWLGTGMEMGLVKWDKNHNGLLEEGEQAACSSGHRYSQVWLGSNYGWICFDGTPTRPAFHDYDQPPPLQTQLRYMQRCAFGHREKRIVFNIGSKLFRPLYSDFENDRGGNQRYNLMGRFDKIDLWKDPGGSIRLENLCFLKDVTLHGEGPDRKVTWTLQGEWRLDPASRLNVDLEHRNRRTGRFETVTRLAEGIPYTQKEVTVDLYGFRGWDYRITVSKDGDPRTGGQSKLFRLPW
ncbi:MAG: hypothetical protein JW818_07750 [Pirellulales bacterium]|nr:hypothetical protein [Pirellulales bacterium]